MNDQEKTETEQTAVANDPNETPTEEVSAESGTAQEESLDDLLKEYDSKREAAESPKEADKPSIEPQGADSIDVTALATLEKRLNDQESREVRRELEGVFSRFSEGVQADDVDAEAFLNAKASRDPRLNKAYQERETNPKVWGEIEQVLIKDFQKRYGKTVDKQVTESRDAVASAVRSASTAAPQREYTPQDVQNASSDEFAEMQRKLGVSPV